MSFTLQEEEVVKWVNSVRRRFRAEPLHILPKGKRNDSRSCPVAKALGSWAYVENASYGEVIEAMSAPASWYKNYKKFYQEQRRRFSARRIGGLPTHVQAFIRAFDEGKFPWMEG